MTKPEFIELLAKLEYECSERGLNHWRCVSMDNNHWNYLQYGIDGLTEDMDLSEDGVVKITFWNDSHLYPGSKEPEVIKTTYDSYSKLLKR